MPNIVNLSSSVTYYNFFALMLSAESNHVDCCSNSLNIDIDQKFVFRCNFLYIHLYNNVFRNIYKRFTVYTYTYVRALLYQPLKLK